MIPVRVEAVINIKNVAAGKGIFLGRKTRNSQFLFICVSCSQEQGQSHQPDRPGPFFGRISFAFSASPHSAQMTHGRAGCPSGWWRKMIGGPFGASHRSPQATSAMMIGNRSIPFGVR